MEKHECVKDWENYNLIMSEEKCGNCKHYYECRFMKQAMDEVVYGTD